MNKDEKACWASGGVWMDGQCVKVRSMTLKMPRGTGCELVEATIRKHLDPEVRKTRAKILQKLEKKAR